MIILDSSVLRAIGFPSSTSTVLTLLAENTKHPIALPETVLREYVSFRRRNLKSAIDRTRTSIRELAGAAMDWDGQAAWQNLPYPDIAEITTSTERLLRGIFRILPLTGETAREALFREADRIPPAEITEKGGGARDASIWLTVVDACKTASPAKVYFVCGDGGDFGAKGVLNPTLAAEAPENLVYCAGVDKVIAELGDPDEQAGEEAAQVLRTENVRQLVERELVSGVIFAELAAGVSPALTGTAVRSEGQHQLRIEGEPRRVYGFRVGDTRFATGEVVWRSERVYVFLRDQLDFPALRLQFSVRTMIAVAMTQEGAIRAAQVVHRWPLADIKIADASARFVD